MTDDTTAPTLDDYTRLLADVTVPIEDATPADVTEA